MLDWATLVTSHKIYYVKYVKCESDEKVLVSVMEIGIT